jgi:4-hydroxybenzoyl-CoA reductase subunit beta
MQPFALRRPATLDEAVALLGADPRARVLAGGTDLVPNLRRGIEQPSALIDLALVAGIADVRFDPQGLTLGAGVRLGRLSDDAQIVRQFRALAEAAQAIAGPGHRSAATLGGNLCLDTRCVFYNQSAWWRAANDFCLKRGGTTCHVAPQGAHCHAAFSGDLAPALLAFDAQVDVVSTRGTRRVPLVDLYRDDGAAHLQLARDELVARVWVPPPASHCVSGYRKARVRAALDFPLAGVALALVLRDGALTHLRVALTGVNSQPIVLEGTRALLGQPVTDRSTAALGRLVQKQVSPMRTTVTASNHRRLVAAALAQRLLRELAQDGLPASTP